MTDECNFSIPEDASREDLAESLMAYHEYVHTLEDALTDVRESFYSLAGVNEILAERLIDGNRFGNRGKIITEVATKLVVIGTINKAMSGVDIEKMQTDVAFEEIVRGMGD